MKTDLLDCGFSGLISQIVIASKFLFSVVVLSIYFSIILFLSLPIYIVPYQFLPPLSYFNLYRPISICIILFLSFYIYLCRCLYSYFYWPTFILKVLFLSSYLYSFCTNNIPIVLFQSYYLYLFRSISIILFLLCSWSLFLPVLACFLFLCFCCYDLRSLLIVFRAAFFHCSCDYTTPKFAKSSTILSPAGALIVNLINALKS